MDRNEQRVNRIESATEIASSYEREMGISAVDGLTGLFRHSVLHLILSSIVAHANQDRDTLSLAILDVDRFETVNRRDGYTEGDRYLKKAGAAILQTLRGDDIAGRLQNAVFGIIMRDTSSVDAMRIIERVKRAIAASTTGETTMSAGIATYPLCGVSVDALLTNAITALGEAKLRGQDRVHVFEPAGVKREIDEYTIMVVDDDAQSRKLLTAFLNKPGYEVVEASSAGDALGRVRKNQVDLILSDVRMPEMDGYEFCRHIKTAESTRMIPFVLVTGYAETEQRVRGIESGADDFLTKPLDRTELLARTKSLLKVRKMNRDFTTIESVLFTLINAIEAKDSYTQGHTERVATLAAEVGRQMGLNGESISALRLGGILHDIGKIGIASRVLNKTGPLTDEEWSTMKSHPELGYKICLPLKKSLGIALDIVRHHHEKLDGSSYPDGLAGNALSVETQITAVVDMYDAMTTNRPYRSAMNREKAVEILREDAAAGKINGLVIDHLVEIIHASSDTERRSEDPEGKQAKCILIVEDDELNLKLIRTILQLAGYRVLEAIDAESGIVTAQAEHPDLILMDIQLPGMNGITAAGILSACEGLEQVPIVAISSYAMREDVENAMNAGCVGYITKPIDTNAFPEEIAQYLHGTNHP